MPKKSQKSQNELKAKSVLFAWSDEAWEDYLYWQKADQGIMGKINDLLRECQRTPFSGTGKPEPLKADIGHVG